jgi:enoyl-[acyl-carrier-protein] reductase (NADH)
MSCTIPLHHGNATQIAEVQQDAITSPAVFLCSDAAAQITGTNLSVDGGGTAE